MRPIVGLLAFIGNVISIVVVCLGLFRDSTLRDYAKLCLDFLCEVAMRGESNFAFSMKWPGPDPYALDPPRWRPQTREHAAFLSSEVYEVTLTTFRRG